MSSPAGKKRLAPRLVKLLPKHRVYVEPFAGSAAVLFEKVLSCVPNGNANLDSLRVP